jgi:glycerophosphoryl diester phosphodiesterase
LEAKRRGYKTALIEWESTRSPASARQYGEYYIRAYKYVTKKQVLRYVNSGLKVIITTPNKPKLWKKYSNMGVWGIMHNKPRAYDKWRKA